MLNAVLNYLCSLFQVEESNAGFQRTFGKTGTQLTRL